ncbi:response regulator transcription factor [Frigidibacter albus]
MTTGTTQKSRILIADDHLLVREVVASYLATQSGAVVSGADTLTDALALIAKDGPFDLVMLDLAMPGMNGLGGLSQALAANAPRPVVLFSGQATRAVVFEALELGAAGFIPKNLSARSLLNAVKFVLSGEVFLPSNYFASHTTPVAAGPAGKALSAREVQVLRGVRNGLMNKEIARQLDLSEATVKMYVRAICSKLEVKNRTQAAILAAEVLPDQD